MKKVWWLAVPFFLVVIILMWLLINITGLAVIEVGDGGIQFPGYPGSDTENPNGIQTEGEIVSGGELESGEAPFVGKNQNCGNGICEPEVSETTENCPTDCAGSIDNIVNENVASENQQETSENQAPGESVGETIEEFPVVQQEQRTNTFEGIDTYRICTIEGQMVTIFGKPPAGYKEPVDCTTENTDLEFSPSSNRAVNTIEVLISIMFGI